jgi:phospholipid/cholesterol/gamma-HCH transport system substrate-binding protein
MPGEQPQASSPVAQPRSGPWVTILIVAIGLGALGVFWIQKLSFGPSLRLSACFQDVDGLRAGAKVRLAGVDVGAVRNVRAQPTDKLCPGAVEMELRTPYELKIPRDSVASIATAGVLGETYLEIDASGASGPPIQAGGQIPSKESVKFTPATVDRILKEFANRLSDEEKNCNCGVAKTQSARPLPRPSAPSVPK